jgi:hypothetical protein
MRIMSFIMLDDRFRGLISRCIRWTDSQTGVMHVHPMVALYGRENPSSIPIR